MKWLQDNPLGMALAATSGVFTLLALVMAIIWSLPVAVETDEIETEEKNSSDTVLAAHQIGPISDFQVINEKPVFNESRQPVLGQNDDSDLTEDESIAVKGAPDVRLTGVVITPGMRIASLTPADGTLESVMAYEGQFLTGEFVGWQVSSVSPRNVVLESRDGQKLELDLQVHDSKITEPPKPAVPVRTAQAEPGQDEEMLGEDGQALSRAEQIRQRIAERREELRLEQEQQQQQAPGNARAAGASNNSNKTPKPPSYQEAIRSLMKNNSKEPGSNDKKDG